MPSAHMNVKRFETVVYVAHHQFYLEDANLDWDGRYSNNPWGRGDGLGIAAGVIGVLTSRAAAHTPVFVELLDKVPSEPDSSFDKVTAASIDVSSGALRVLGEENNESSPALEISLPAGTYEIRVLYANLDTITYDDDDGAEHYVIQVFPGAAREPAILRPFEAVDDPVRTTSKTKADVESGLASNDPSVCARALVDLARCGAIDIVADAASKHASRAMRLHAVNALRLVNARQALEPLAKSEDLAIRGNVTRALEREE